MKAPRRRAADRASLDAPIRLDVRRKTARGRGETERERNEKNRERKRNGPRKRETSAKPTAKRAFRIRERESTILQKTDGTRHNRLHA